MNNMRDILDLINEMSEEEGSVELHDEFDIELSEEVIIESGVIDINEDGILIEGDERSLQLLEEHGLILEDADWSKYDEPTINRIKSGKTKPVDRTDYDKPAYQRKKEKEEKKEVEEALDLKTLRAAAASVSPKGSSDKKFDPKAKVDDKKEIPYKDGKLDLNALRDMVKEEDVEESGLQAYLGKKKYGPKGMQALQKAGREGASKEKMAKIRAKYDKLDEVGVEEGVMPFDKVYPQKAEPEIRTKDGRDAKAAEAPTYAVVDIKTGKHVGTFRYGAGFMPSAPGYTAGKLAPNGTKVDYNQVIDEAKYQGREVPLGKPMAGDVKKSKVYVKKPNGKVVKVNFGDKKMRIKKSNPKRRKSFRARHNCKNPGPRWKARYWSCRAW